MTAAGLGVLIRAAVVMCLIVPLSLLGLKVIDRLVRDEDTTVWRDIGSGIFGKLDDLSFWVVVSGLLSVTMVCAAINQLMKSKTDAEVGWPIRRFHVLAWMVMSAIAVVAYLIGIFLTNGTFFIETTRQDRVAQVPEGLLNVLMIQFIYFYCILGLQATHSVRTRLRSLDDQQIDEPTLLAAEYLLNISFAFVLGAILAFAVVVGLQWLGEGLFRLTNLAFFDWTVFKPNPLSELQDSLIAVAFITIVLFAPLLVFFPMVRGSLPGHVRMRLNLKATIETVTVSASGIQPVSVKVSYRVPRFVVLTLIKLVQNTTVEEVNGS